MIRGVTVRLLKLPEPIVRDSCYWTLRGMRVGDIGYVTGAWYPTRLVSVRFGYGELWLRAQDVERVRRVTAVMIDDAARAAHAYPWPWRK